MTDPATYQNALDALRGVMALSVRPGSVYQEIIESKGRVLARYQPLFSPEHLDELQAEGFRSFLYFENNHHWTGLYRRGGLASDDMPTLRRGLRTLLDETRPIEKRYLEAISAVPGMGKALATAILTVAYPDKYGVWNNTSEAGLRQLGLWPTFERGATPGERYAKVSETLVQIARDLGTDLWTLDSLWWALADGPLPPPPPPEPPGTTVPPPLPPLAPVFPLEKHLEEFLVGNWDRTALGQEWAIHAAADEPEVGQQFPTDIGRIDILAKHRSESRWLVIELKRAQSTDETVGQVLRYMGWIKRHLAAPSDTVEGLVIAHQADKALRYALEAVPSVSALLYEVQFRLFEPSS